MDILCCVRLIGGQRQKRSVAMKRKGQRERGSFAFRVVTSTVPWRYFGPQWITLFFTTPMANNLILLSTKSFTYFSPEHLTTRILTTRYLTLRRLPWLRRPKMTRLHTLYFQNSVSIHILTLLYLLKPSIIWIRQPVFFRHASLWSLLSPLLEHSLSVPGLDLMRARCFRRSKLGGITVVGLRACYSCLFGC